MTNTSTGLFRPVPVSDDTLFAFHYTSAGFIPVMLDTAWRTSTHRFLGQDIVEKHPVVKEWMLPPPSAVDLDALRAEKGPTSRAKTRGSRRAIRSSRTIAATQPSVALQLHGSGRLRALDVSASVTPQSEVPNNEKFHFPGTYSSGPGRSGRITTRPVSTTSSAPPWRAAKATG